MRFLYGFVDFSFSFVWFRKKLCWFRKVSCGFVLLEPKKTLKMRAGNQKFFHEIFDISYKMSCFEFKKFFMIVYDMISYDMNCSI